MADAGVVSYRTWAAVFVILAGYSWVMTGVRPFSSTSYLVVAVPSVAFVIAYVLLGGLSHRRADVDAYYQRHAEGATLRSVTPWITLLIAAVLLEVIGLLLGGRSTSVPTLSTAIDHLLEQHWVRFLICLTWLLAGAIPIFGLLSLRELREK
jgi:hypothetical protein